MYLATIEAESNGEGDLLFITTNFHLPRLDSANRDPLLCHWAHKYPVSLEPWTCIPSQKGEFQEMRGRKEEGGVTVDLCRDWGKSQLVIRLDDWRLEDPAFGLCKPSLSTLKSSGSPISRAWSESFNKEEGAAPRSFPGESSTCELRKNRSSDQNTQEASWE